MFLISYIFGALIIASPMLASPMLAVPIVVLHGVASSAPNIVPGLKQLLIQKYLILKLAMGLKRVCIPR